MARGRTESFVTHRLAADGLKREPDDLIVEEPLSIRLDDVLVSTTMRTPGNDFELAAGFCHAEGLLDGATIGRIRYCGEGPPVESEFNVVSVETDGAGPPPVPRLGMTTSSCGICGAEAVERLTATLRPLPAVERFDPEVLAAVPERMITLQGSSPPRGPCTQPASPTAAASRCWRARTSAATTPSTRWWAACCWTAGSRPRRCACT